jgi:hypothetical protein
VSIAAATWWRPPKMLNIWPPWDSCSRRLRNPSLQLASPSERDRTVLAAVQDQRGTRDASESAGAVVRRCSSSLSSVGEPWLRVLALHPWDPLKQPKHTHGKRHVHLSRSCGGGADQYQALHAFRMGGGELQGDAATHRHAGHVDRGKAEHIHQSCGVLGEHGDAVGRIRFARAPRLTVVERNNSTLLRKLTYQR